MTEEHLSGMRDISLLSNTSNTCDDSDLHSYSLENGYWRGRAVTYLLRWCCLRTAGRRAGGRAAPGCRPTLGIERHPRPRPQDMTVTKTAAAVEVKNNLSHKNMDNITYLGTKECGELGV